MDWIWFIWSKSESICHQMSSPNPFLESLVLHAQHLVGPSKHICWLSNGRSLSKQLLWSLFPEVMSSFGSEGMAGLYLHPRCLIQRWHIVGTQEIFVDWNGTRLMSSIKTATLAIRPKSTLGVYSPGHGYMIRDMSSFKAHKLFLCEATASSRHQIYTSCPHEVTSGRD